jgi:hypothetical protein
MPWLAHGPRDLTVLTAHGRRLAKLIKPDGIDPYDDAKWFRPDAVRIDVIEDLAELLHRQAFERSDCIIRAVPKRAFAHYPEVRRLLHDRPGAPATFEEVPRSWVMVDIEPAVAPPWIDPTDPVETGGYLRQQLPAPFRVARTIAQLSGGAGIKPGLRCHLWFLTDRPMTGAELKRLLDGTPGFDDATVRPVQIHYVAAPEFDGVDDPCGERIEILPGLAEVAVGHVPDPVVRQAFTPGRAFAPVGVAGVGSAERRAQARLRRLAATQPGQRHPELIKAAYHLLGLAKAGLLDPIRVAAMIKGVCAPWGDLSEVDRALSWAWTALSTKEPGK